MPTLNTYQNENLNSSVKKRLLFQHMQVDVEGMSCAICGTRSTSTIMYSTMKELCKIFFSITNREYKAYNTTTNSI